MDYGIIIGDYIRTTIGIHSPIDSEMKVVGPATKDGLSTSELMTMSPKPEALILNPL